MRSRKFLSLFLFLLSIPAGLLAQINVNQIDASFDPASREGIIYALPRTVVQIDVTVEHKELLAGPLRNYAEEYMGINDYIRSNGNAYSFKSIGISTFAEPDPDQYYFIALQDKSSREDWKTILNLSGSGMISSMDVMGQPSADGSQLLPAKLSNDEVRSIFQKYASLNLFEKVDTIVRTINIDTITIEDYTFKTTTTAMPLELKAEEIARKIETIREDRYKLLTGYQEVNYSEGALKFMNEELQELEQEYLRLFTGAVITKELRYSIIYLPDAGNAGSEVPVFRMSENNGVSKNGNGDQATIKIIPSGNTAGMGTSGNAANGIYYRLPEQAQIEIRMAGNIISQSQATISQLGKVAVLPTTAYDVEFDGQTGGLKSLKLDAQ